MSEQCSRCKYWDEYGDGQFERVGFCLRFPPVIDSEDEWVSPVTGKTDWCGEYKKGEANVN